VTVRNIWLPFLWQRGHSRGRSQTTALLIRMVFFAWLFLFRLACFNPPSVLIWMPSRW
jgi:hypothetical protein